MKVEQVSTSELHEYERNVKKHDADQVKMVARSIEQFGMNQPIAIDETGMILAGHGRFLACKELGMEKVPCVRIKGLTDDEKKAYILADNSTNAATGFDMKGLSEELASIANIDMGEFGFELPKFDFDLDDRTRDDERLRTDRSYNLDIVNVDDCSEWWEFPVITKDLIVPDEMIGFNYVLNSDVSDFCVHFFVDDYQFERVWNDPDKYVEPLKAAQCVLTPDFSMYLDMPLPLKLYNVYRSRAMGHYWQRMGLKVIPTLQWADEKTFKFCFKGIERGSVVAVSTIGVKTNPDATAVWNAGMDEAIKQVAPSTILLYGGNIGYDFGDIPVVEFSNTVTERMKEL